MEKWGKICGKSGKNQWKTWEKSVEKGGKISEKMG